MSDKPSAARRPVVFRAFAAFDALLLATLVFVFVRSHGQAAFFDRQVALDEQLNSTMVGREIGAYPTGMRLAFRPSASTRVLYAIWNFESPDGDWEMMRLGSLGAHPSAWIVVRGGRVIETKPVSGALDVPWTFAFADGRIRVDVDGRAVLDEPFDARTTTVHFALTPAWVFRTLRPPWSALRELSFDYADHDGKPATIARASPWWWALAALAMALGTMGMFLALDRAVCRKLLARGRVARLITGYPVAVVLLPIAFVLFFGAWESAKRESGDLNWYRSFLLDGVFDEAAFRADPVLRRGGKEIRVPIDPDTVVIAAHGGSTTDGYPYPRGRWDWPTRLGEKIAADPGYAARAVRVLNLSYVSDLLENNFPPGVEGFYQAARPRVAVIHTVVNNYYSYRPTEALANGFGFWSHRDHHTATETGSDPLKRFLVLLREKIRLCRKAGAWPVVVIPALDPDAFDRDPPMDDWSEATIAVACDEDVGVVDLRPAFRARAAAGDILFQEFMHPNRAGYDLVADEIWRSLRENRDRWWPSGPTP